MSPDQLLILLPAFFLLAALYTSVGHAGASGYLAAMALVAIAPETMRPTALALNILVATFTTWRFWKAGYVSWRALWPFLLGSVPLAALGGSLRLTTGLYYVLAGCALALSAIVLAWRAWGGVAPEDTRASGPDSARPGHGLRGGHRPAVRTDGDRGRHLSVADRAARRLGRAAAYGGHFGALHPGQFERLRSPRARRPGPRSRPNCPGWSSRCWPAP